MSKEDVRELFDRLAPTYSAQMYRNSTSHVTRQAKILGHIVELGRHTPLLDLGCGSGDLLRFLRNVWGWLDLSGCDISPAMVKQASKWGKVLAADAEDLPYDDDSFGVVIAAGVMEYLPAQDIAMREISRVLAPNGMAIITYRNALLDVWSANDHTLARDDLPRLIEEIAAVEFDQSGILLGLRGFTDVIREQMQYGYELGAQSPAGPSPDLSIRRVKYSPRQIREQAAEACLCVTEMRGFNAHPLPPGVLSRMGAAGQALKAAADHFDGTGLDLVICSGLIATMVPA